MKGAEAVVIDASFNGTLCLRKQRLPKKYRMAALDSSLRTARTSREARVLEKAAAVVSCPKVLHVDPESASIYMTKLPGRLARELKLSDSVLKKIGKDLRSLHALGVVHGDCTTSNILVDGEKVAWIDFGLSEFSNSVEAQATDLLLLKKSLNGKEFGFVLAGYGADVFAKKVLTRLNEIESRGRYVARSQAA